jgi:hypothetical protein
MLYICIYNEDVQEIVIDIATVKRSIYMPT